MTRLRELRIQGFKSFANSTGFVFDEGVTAIVGPNGSGKSNVAEALRWVLGEQHYTALRGRRTEDVIFAGSERRGQLGMAEVTLLLDNSDGGLATEYRELALSRRAFRSGESHYLINGSRVRLKDVQQLTAPLGQAHTIIGQGLVDAVLSQRPEDRRGLFEHAAGIAGLRLRAVAAERSLAEASGNAQRLHDILAELEPRVRSLERAARQAREYGALRDRLAELQRGNYAALWADAAERLEAAQAALASSETTLASAEHEQRQASQQLASLRVRERELSARISALERELIEGERTLAELGHRIELLEADRHNRVRRIAELDIARRELGAQLEQAAREEAAANESMSALQTTLSAARQELAEREARQEIARAQFASHERALAALEQEVGALQQDLIEVETQHSRMSERWSILSEERVARADALREEETAAARLAATLLQIGEQLDELRERQTCQQQQVQTRDEAVAAHRATVQQARGALEALERKRIELGTRLELLERSADSGEGLHGGARAVLHAVHRSRLELPGLVGTLAELINVPAGYETAIEVALGGHVQDLVVERWSDAETAIEFLKRANSGRATFQPLETIRRPRSVSIDVTDPALLGSAFELIGCRPEVEPVLAQLLQRTLVVSDLEAARRLLSQSRAWTIVTLHGELARPGGSVTGGAAARGAGLLARERERRELPEQLQHVKGQREQACAALAEAERTLQHAEQQGTQMAAELADTQDRARELLAQQTRLQADHVRATQRAERAGAAFATIEERQTQLTNLRVELATRRTVLGEQLTERQAEAERVREQHAQREPLDDGGSTALKIELATLSERLTSLDRDARRARSEAEAAEQAGSARAAELCALQEQQRQASEQRRELEREHGDLCAALTERRQAAPPLEQERDGLLDRMRAAERAIDITVNRLRGVERERDNAALNLARVRDERVFLVERIQTDLELDDPTALDAVEARSGPEIEQEVRRLRERLRRTSAVGEEVIEEHVQEAARLEHLSRELADVEQAAQSLRRLLSELRSGMQQRFQATFEQVAAEFERTFSRLFGGGAARLSLLTGEDDDGGVAIEARPPGKRLQNLGQLSGGERALTAVALLFAIQRVNPSPFCVLDEVDAALDESNVLRFRDELRDLARTTQYIVITHNRGTIEGADTLYGITMGEDSVSRVVSLRLEQAIQQVEEREQVERPVP